ncbi:MAG: CsgG/HfaB family protein [Bacteroidota bacterium]
MNRILSLSILLLLSYNVLKAQNVECFVLTAPETRLTEVKRLSVLDFSGEKGRQLTDYLIVELMKTDRGIKSISGGLFSSAKEGKTFQKGARTNLYSVVERDQIDKVLKEQNFSNSGIVDDAQATQIGKVLGIDAIISGSVSYTSKDEQSETTTFDLSGKSSTVPCLKRTVTAEARIRIISVTTGLVIGVSSPKAEFYERKCGSERSGLQSAAAIANACYQDLAFKLANSFSPYFKNVKFEFEKIKTKEFKDKSKQALEYIESSDFDKAANIYKAILEADPYTAAAAYNLGCLNTIVGNYDEAYQYYKTASEIDEAAFGQYVKKAEAQVEMNKILQAMGISIEKQGFESSTSALADKVKTRGNKSDRYDAREKPDEGSASVARIPGDTEFTVIKREGDWYLIKLLGGKQGYINQSFVK